MPKVAYNAAIRDIRGSIGDITFSHDGSAGYLKERTTPTNPNSPAQQEVRTNLSEITKAWRTCTNAQRAGWEELAGSVRVYDSLTGKPRRLSAFQLFVRLNCNRALIDLPVQKAFPLEDNGVDVPLPDGELPERWAVKSVGTTAAPVIAGVLSPGEVLAQAVVVYATRPLTAGTTAQPKQGYRRIGFAAAGVNTSGVTIGQMYRDTFGRVPDATKNEKFALKLQCISTDGFASTPVVLCFTAIV